MTLASVVAGLLMGMLVLAFAGYNPLEAYAVMFTGIFIRPSDWSFSIIRATPLILTGLSVAFAFKTGLFNIGAEGQYIIGALTAAAVGVLLPLPAPIHIPVVMILAAFAGAGWGALAGWFKSRWGVHEVISTIMLNWIALYLNNTLVMITGFNRPESEATQKILDSARIDILGAWKTTAEGLAFRQTQPFMDDIFRTSFNAGILFAVLAVIVIWIILNKTSLGFDLKAVGYNKNAAEFAGINVKKSIVLSMAIAGALAGLSGSLQVQGVSREVAKLAAMEGNGFDGIAVALIGQSQPWGVLGAGIFYGALKHGGPKIQPAMGAPLEIIQIVMGTIVFFLALPGLWPHLSKLLKRRRKKEEP